MCSNAREVTLLQIDRSEVYPHMALQRAREVGDLLYRPLNVADAVNGHRKGRFVQLVSDWPESEAAAFAQALERLASEVTKITYSEEAIS